MLNIHSNCLIGRPLLRLRWIVLLVCVSLAGAPMQAAEPVDAAKLKVLLITGQNNHNWRVTHPVLKKTLEETGHIAVDLSITPGKDANAAEWNDWRPAFSDYDCLMLDYNGQMWPEEVKKSFVSYIRGGGGAVLVHASNNAFTGWDEFEQMVGMLWRKPSYGARLYVDEDGNVVRQEAGTGPGAGHGKLYDWLMTGRDADHPILKGMPQQWMHKHDELYHGQRGPANDIHILLTAYSAPENGGTGRHEPIVWWTKFGQGKVVTNVAGHVWKNGQRVDCLRCVGFRTVLQRSCEWAAKGECMTAIPDNFPTADATSMVDAEKDVESAGEK